jgi:tripartite-type tricarboxylate transporter receptor subunit TctC
MYRHFEYTTESRPAQVQEVLLQHLKDYPTFQEQGVKQTFQEQRGLLQDQSQVLKASRQVLQQQRDVLKKQHEACQEQHLALQEQRLRRQKKQMWLP